MARDRGPIAPSGRRSVSTLEGGPVERGSRKAGEQFAGNRQSGAAALRLVTVEVVVYEYKIDVRARS